MLVWRARRAVRAYETGEQAERPGGVDGGRARHVEPGREGRHVEPGREGRHVEPGEARGRVLGAPSLDGMDSLIAVVTGANKGIGKEIARQLAGAGHTVYVGSRDAARGQRAVEEMGGDARPLVLDVTDDASIADAADRVGALDVLVNNAGISGEDRTPDLEDPGTFRRIFETNVFGVVAITNAFLPALRRSAHPRIVNISSGTGSLTWATGPQFAHRGSYAAYRSSKAALNALTVFYAHSLAGDGIKVNALASGLRRTGLNATAAASGGDPAQAAAAAVRLALLPDDGPSGEFLSWDGTPVPW